MSFDKEEIVNPLVEEPQKSHKAIQNSFSNINVHQIAEFRPMENKRLKK